MKVTYDNELEHMRLKLDATQTYLNNASDEALVKFLEKQISVLTRQIKIAEAYAPENNKRT